MNWQGSQGGGFMRGEGAIGGDKPSGGPILSCPPVTIKQILGAYLDPADDTLRIDGRNPNQITLLGRIFSVAQQSTNIVYKIEDGTGSIDVKLWVNNDDNDMEAQKRSEWREGVYIRVVGQLRSFQNTSSVIAYHINVITDYNEITCHILQALHTHLTIIQGANGVSAGPRHTDTFGGNTMTNNTYGQPQRSNQMGFVSPSAANTFAKPVQSDVLAAIRQGNTGPEGTSITEMCNALRHKYKEAEIRSAVEWLSGEGHIYSTISEDNFKPTDEE